MQKHWYQLSAVKNEKHWYWAHKSILVEV